MCDFIQGTVHIHDFFFAKFSSGQPGLCPLSDWQHDSRTSAASMPATQQPWASVWACGKEALQSFTIACTTCNVYSTTLLSSINVFVQGMFCGTKYTSHTHKHTHLQLLIKQQITTIKANVGVKSHWQINTWQIQPTQELCISHQNCLSPKSTSEKLLSCLLIAVIKNYPLPTPTKSSNENYYTPTSPKIVL